ncbi:MAG: hypothetical protein ACO1SX_26740 [Actinomycetota bacterium]
MGGIEAEGRLYNEASPTGKSALREWPPHFALAFSQSGFLQAAAPFLSTAAAGRWLKRRDGLLLG